LDGANGDRMEGGRKRSGLARSFLDRGKRVVISANLPAGTSPGRTAQQPGATTHVATSSGTEPTQLLVSACCRYRRWRATVRYAGQWRLPVSMCVSYVCVGSSLLPHKCWFSGAARVV